MWHATRPSARTAALAAVLALAAGTACGDDDDDDDQGADVDAATGAADAAATGQPDAGAIDAILLPGEEVYPEGAASLADGTLFVGSLNQGTIFRVPPGAAAPEAEPFAEAGDNGLINTTGLLADPARGLLWACSSDLGISPGAGSAPPGLKAFDLATGAPAGSYDLPGGGFCNDVALDADGNAYVTDSFGPRILRLPADGTGLEIWLEDERFGGEGFNLNGIAVDGADLYTVKYNTGELYRVPIGEDGEPGEVTALAVDPTLESPDGLRVEASGTLLVVEGVGRLTRIAVGDGAPVSTVISDQLDGPASVALIGSDAWLTETQLVHLTDPESGPPELPFRIERVSLE